MNSAVQSRWSYTVIDDVKLVEKTVDEILTGGFNVLGLGLRIFNSRVSIVQIAGWDNEKGRGVVHIFDAVRMRGLHQVNALLTSTDIVKVIHGCRDANTQLEMQFKLRLVNVFDTQVAYSVIKSQRDGQRTDQVDEISLDDLCAEYRVLRNPIAETLEEELKTDPAQWRRRPLTNSMKELALMDTLVLIPLYVTMNPLINDKSSFDRLTSKQLSDLELEDKSKNEVREDVREEEEKKFIATEKNENFLATNANVDHIHIK